MTDSTSKPPARGAWGIKALSWVLAGYLRFVHLTGHWTTRNADIPERYAVPGKPVIFATWHGRIALCVYYYPPIRHHAHALISEHKDGELIARTIGRFGYPAVRGSTRSRKKAKQKGGARALREMVRLLRAGESVLVTPDGPRGPRMRVSSGIAALARLSEAPVVPVTWSCKRGHLFQSWDRFLLPLPFSQGLILWGEPLTLSKDAGEAEQAVFLARLEDRLNALTAEADAVYNRPAIAPAEEAPDDLRAAAGKPAFAGDNAAASLDKPFEA